jgi:hypothetical protein
MRWSARAVAALAVGTFVVSWGLSACLSPTLPLPPPSDPEVAVLSADGKTVRIEGGGALRGALVMGFNEEPTVEGGAVATADSSGWWVLLDVPVDLSVHPTNRIRISQRYGSDDSDAIYTYVPFHVRFGAPSDEDAGAPEAGGRCAEGSSAACETDAGTSDAGE